VAFKPVCPIATRNVMRRYEKKSWTNIRDMDATAKRRYDDIVTCRLPNRSAKRPKDRAATCEEKIGIILWIKVLNKDF